MIALVFERPWALVLLVLPVLLLLARVRRANRVLAAGDLEPWREARALAGPPRAARPVPPTVALLLALLSLTCAVLAIASPRSSTARAQWTCVLDTTPSMDLPAAGSTRRECAIEAARSMAREQGVELVWIAAAGGRSADPTPELALEGVGTTTGDPFAAWDVPGHLWITDVAPSSPPRFAGYVASGGEAVPGGIAIEGPDRVEWDGARVSKVAGAAPPVRIDGLQDAAPDSPLARLLEAWITARGYVTSSDPGSSHVLFFIGVRGANSQDDVRAGRDGWSAMGPRLGTIRLDRDEDRGLVPWISSGEDVLVAAGPGRIELAWMPGEPSDGPAFAVSWARLFDEIARPPPGIVPLDERLAAGPARSVAPEAAADGSSTNFAGVLGLAAAALALAAIVARRG